MAVELKVTLSRSQVEVLFQHLHPYVGDRVPVSTKAASVKRFVQELVNRTVAEIEDGQLHNDDIPF